MTGTIPVKRLVGAAFMCIRPRGQWDRRLSDVSQGCINLSPDSAAWYFDTVYVGEPIIVE
jgi:hypothetical protein